MIYHLPNVHSNRTGFEQLGNLATATEHLFADELQLDMSQVGSFDANMAAPLGAVLARVMDDFNSVEIISISKDVERILRRNRFLTYYRYESIDDVDRNCILFRRLRLSDEGAFEEYIRRQLRGRGIPEMSRKANQRFKMKVFEVYQNAVTHSESDVGIFVCGQIFREQNRLDFTIADGGIGIRVTIEINTADKGMYVLTTEVSSEEP